MIHDKYFMKIYVHVVVGTVVVGLVGVVVGVVVDTVVVGVVGTIVVEGVVDFFSNARKKLAEYRNLYINHPLHQNYNYGPCGNECRIKW